MKYYRVRKSWDDAKSQLGAYTMLGNAKAMADKNPGEGDMIGMKSRVIRR